MKIYFTRDSVCAGDDCDAPHAREIDLPADASIEAIVRAALKASPLASISGGKATWCVSSGLPLAVIAQEWSEPKFLHPIPPKQSELDRRGETIRLHFSYFAQQDPNVVFEVLRRLRVRAE
jgi:hypothetical protein